MKATLTADGFIMIEPESVAESLALKHILPDETAPVCIECGQQAPLPVVVSSCVREVTSTEKEDRHPLQVAIDYANTLDW